MAWKAKAVGVSRQFHLVIRQLAVIEGQHVYEWLDVHVLPILQKRLLKHQAENQKKTKL